MFLEAYADTRPGRSSVYNQAKSILKKEERKKNGFVIFFFFFFAYKLVENGFVSLYAVFTFGCAINEFKGVYNTVFLCVAVFKNSKIKLVHTQHLI